MTALLDSLKESDFRDAIERAGGGSAVRASMLAFQQASDRMNADYERLLKEFPSNWVAVGAEGLIAHVPVSSSPSGTEGHREALEALLEQLNHLGMDHGGYVVRFLDPNPRKLLL